MKQQKRTELTRQKILAAAMDEFGRNGYGGGSINNICKRGINKGLIYHNFENKDALYLACLQISVNDLVQRMKAVEPSPDNSGTEEPQAVEHDQDISGTEEPQAVKSGKGTPEMQVNAFLQARMRFFEEQPNESHIFFEGMLTPPNHLKDRIREIMVPLKELNSALSQKILAQLPLRSDVTREQAMRYFSMMQYMFNSYFRSPAMQDKDLKERIIEHEKTIPKVLNFMLYGIAKEG